MQNNWIGYKLNKERTYFIMKNIYIKIILYSLRIIAILALYAAHIIFYIAYYNNAYEI